MSRIIFALVYTRTFTIVPILERGKPYFKYINLERFNIMVKLY